MKLVVYTCVFGGYDWVFPPIQIEPDLDYIIITDNPLLQVAGWNTKVVDVSSFRNSKTANLYYRALFHEVVKGYNYSLYIDGNIRLLGKTLEFFSGFITSGDCLGVFRHPYRSKVQEEAQGVVLSGKVIELSRIKSELDFQKNKGFPDNVGLFETGVLLKNHNHKNLNCAMELWWSMFERFGTRDQVSFPYVIWACSVECFIHASSFRDKNPYFAIYHHRCHRVTSPTFSYVEGRSFDSLFYSAILKLWKGKWVLYRFIKESIAKGKTLLLRLFKAASL